MSRSYDGAVVFGSDGVHYAVDKNGDPDKNKPLRAADGGGWRHAEEGDPLHNDVNHLADLELVPGSED